MYNIALRIKAQDWLYILAIGVIFAMLLSSLGYILLERSWLQGAVFGVMLGFSITLFSLIFITLMNQFILPKVRQTYWLPMAVCFSFLSGFLGTIVSTLGANLTKIELIPIFRTELGKIAVAIGVLTYVVGALLYRFVKMRNEKEEVDHHYVQSRLSSLEIQLNPHFLFNALNSIAELIHQDPEKAEDAVLKVSAFLRNTMNEEALIPLRDEVKNARDYIELENIRFSGKIHLDVPETIPLLKVPKFSIQLLIENAIKHGFETNGKSLTVTLSFDMQGHSLSVSNDGKAMRSTQFGIGLKNLQQRLELLCKGRLSITDRQHPTFTIYLGEKNANTDR